MSDIEYHHEYQEVTVVQAHHRLAQLADAHSNLTRTAHPHQQEGFYRSHVAMWRVGLRSGELALTRLPRINTSDPEIPLSVVPMDDIVIRPGKRRAVITRYPSSELDLEILLGQGCAQYDVCAGDRGRGSEMKMKLSPQTTLLDLWLKDPPTAEMLSAALNLTPHQRYVTALATSEDVNASKTAAPMLYQAAVTAAARWEEIRREENFNDMRVLRTYRAAGQVVKLVSIRTPYSTPQQADDGFVAKRVKPPQEGLAFSDTPNMSYGLVFRDQNEAASLLVHGNQPIVEALYTSHHVEPPRYLFHPVSRQLQLDRLSGRCHPLPDSKIAPYYKLLEAALSA
jgi:hypothetical protein